jgi:hypothetical protein
VLHHSSAGAQKDELGAVLLLISQGCGVVSLLMQRNEPAGEIILDLTALAFGFVGLYFAFTGDAKGWFRPAWIR